MSDAQPPVILIIRDGWGENPNPAHDAFNAIKLAKTPVDELLRENYPHTLITTSGEDVGLPARTMGNSEVGHQNIGAGRIVDQEIMRITRAIRDESFFENAAFLKALKHCCDHQSNLHIMGLVSDGQVHSDIEHLLALLALCHRKGCPGDRVFVHAFMDGRDTGPMTGLGFIHHVEAKMVELGVGKVASVIGRFYAMDRDHRWERTAAAYAALTGRGDNTPVAQASPPVKNSTAQIGDAVRQTNHPKSARETPATHIIQNFYNNPTSESARGDEFIPPTVITDLPRISDNDAIIFFNFRGDRPRQITRAFTLDDQAWSQIKGGGFERGQQISNLCFVSMSAYETGLPVSAVAFEKPPKMPDILGEVVSQHGLTQFRCAETEKFAHVTFFFNDYREEPFPGEHRLLCPSPQDVMTYDHKPAMSAAEVCNGVLHRLDADDCEALIVVNFANPDMVGHTGSLEATIQAVETVDACVGRIVERALERNASLVITADHGNAEQMWNPEHDSPHTAHTTNRVSLILVSEKLRDVKLRDDGRLADLSPTILELMGLPQPDAMTGRSLLT